MSAQVKALAVAGGPEWYLARIRHVPLLTAEDERRLAFRWYESRDREAGQALVLSNLRFVVKIARQYTRYGFRLQDLIQEGNIGLLHAVDRFDPHRGYRLISYAVWWIRAHIQSFILRSWSIVRVGTTRAQRRIFSGLQKARARIAAFSGAEPPNNKQLAEALDISEQDFTEAVTRIRSRDISLDAPVSRDEEGRSFGDTLADDRPDAETRLIESDLAEKVRRKLDDVYEDLCPRERYLLERRMLSDTPVTLEAAGHEFGVTRERVRQIEERLKAKLRGHLAGAFAAA